ncbi:thioredoxin-like domain-containing protein, partial [Phialemonium atrogriseum]
RERSSILESEWQSAVSTSTENLVSIDCTVDTDVCAEAGVQSIPEIHLFRGSEPVNRYHGPRRATTILHFAGRHRRPVVSQVTAETSAGFKTADEVTFLAYIDAGDESSREAFARVAERYRGEFTFGLASGVDPPDGVARPAVVCYRAMDDDTATLSSFESAADDLEDWVKEASRPAIGELTILNQQRLLDRGRPMIYLFSPSEPDRADLRRTLHRLAKGNRESLTAVTVDPLDFPDLQEAMGLGRRGDGDGGPYPAGAVHQLSTDRVYPYPRGRAVTPSELQRWGLDVIQGRVTPWRAGAPGEEAAGARGGGAGGGGGGRSGVNIKIRVAGRDEL